jgi:tetratricopeptide (TPR) repeat protein
LSDDPDHWRELGIQLRRQGRLDEAVQACRRALEHAPDDAQAWCELAHALRWQGKLDEAYQAAAKAVELAPDLAGAWFNLGAVLVGQGETARGIEAYRKALQLKPEFAEAWSNLGGAFGAQGGTAEEIDAYRRALEINPRLAPVWSNLGDALRSAGEFEQAIAACRKATELDPEFAAAWNNLASALRDDGKHEESVAASERALALAPRLAEAWSNLGSGLQGLGRFEEAIRAHERAIALNSGSAGIHLNLGATLENSGRVAAAVVHYRRALELKPDHADARLNLALALLTLGELREGWERYECRWQQRNAEPKRHDFAPWSGDPSRACRLLVWGEQGIGDEIIYSSMLLDLARSAVDVTLECDPRLAPLFARAFGRITIVPKQTPSLLQPGDFDCQLPLASLGRWLRPALESFPRHAGYLRADPHRTAEYRRRLLADGGDTQRIVGISWLSANKKFGTLKSHRLPDWAGLLATPGVKFLDLQYGDTRAERGAVEQALKVRIGHFAEVDLFRDLEGLAALISACDLVITVSNVTAHMAGALGRAVWVLVPMARGKFWYWFAGRDDSPWYSSMRIYSQQTPGSWREVLDTVARELAAFVANGKMNE